MKTVTLSTLVADTGEAYRTLQHWSDLNILRAERSSDKKGRGIRRRYRAEPLYGERAHALMASALNKLRLPLGDIRHLIYANRLHHDPVELLDKNDPHLEQELRNRAERAKHGGQHPYEAALAGERNVLLVIAPREHDPVTPFSMVYLQDVGAGVFNPKTLKLEKEPLAMMNNELLFNLMRYDPNAHVVSGTGNPAAVVVNLSTIFRPLYSIPAPVEPDDEKEGDQ